MFGAYRTLLALMVLLQHLARVPVIGEYAVFGFYTLSGYLMTFIMHESYGYSSAGRGRYALNRFLRIYPIYWLSCLLSLALIWVLGSEFVTGYHKAIYAPSDLEGVLRNLLLVSTQETRPRLTPPSWALTVELVFYACIGLGLSRARAVTLVWLAVSVLYTIVAAALDLGHFHSYQSPAAASLPFATGACIYHFRGELKRVFQRLVEARAAPAALFALILVNYGLGYLLGGQRGLHFYLNYLLCALMVVALFDRKALPLVSRRTDKLLGDFSYPIYLIHVQVGLVVHALLGQVGAPAGRARLMITLAALPLVFAGAWLMTVAVERPLERIRGRVKAALPPPDEAPR